ncbi:hypothetical protein Peur_023875 [Populus x canadensis]
MNELDKSLLIIYYTSSPILKISNQSLNNLSITTSHYVNFEIRKHRKLYIAKSNRVSWSNGDVSDWIGRPTDNGQDNKDAHHVKTYEVALKDKDFIEGRWSQNNLNNGADLLIPVPPLLCGVLIIGEETIVYCSANVFRAIPIRPVVYWWNFRKNSEGATEEERGRLEVLGEYHLGEFVNRFRHGSLVMHLPDSDGGQILTVIFGTVNGVIEVIASLPREQYLFLEKL